MIISCCSHVFDEMIAACVCICLQALSLVRRSYRFQVILIDCLGEMVCCSDLPRDVQLVDQGCFFF
jgi:hypothetical protein